MRMIRRICVLAALLPAVTGMVSAEDAQRWIFEGLITESDPVLAPSLQSGWVMAGSFGLLPLEMEDAAYDPVLRSGRLTGGIHDAELTVDHYYRLKFEARQGEGLTGFDFQNDHPDHDGRDLLGWFFPIKGVLGESDWSLDWVQIWLADSTGKMITHLPVQIPPRGLDWESAWFRMTFTGKDGETAHADGRIEIFSPVDQVENTGDEGWYGVAADLSRQLLERDQTIAGLQADLRETRARLDGLRRMVDLLIGERSHLQQENALLVERAANADPEVLKKIDQLTVEKSLLETEIAGLSEQTVSLQDQLGDSERDRFQLSQQMAALEATIANLEAASVVVEAPAEELQSVVQPPVALAEPPAAVIEPPAAEPVLEKAPPDPVEDESEPRERSARRFGPRKFR